MIINQATMAGIYKTFSTIFNQALGTAESMADLVPCAAPLRAAVWTINGSATSP
jgi:hypothetical protein